MFYIHLPYMWDAPEAGRLELFLKILKTLEDENKKIFIHCIKNYRVSVFMHIYKKYVWGKKDTKFITPYGYKSNKV